MSLFDIAASLSLDTSGFEKGLSGARTAANKIGSGLKTVGSIGAKAIGAITGASVALTGALVKGTAQTAEYGDHIDKMSQKIGISAKAYQEWDAILQHNGASVDSLQTAIKTLSNAAQSGSDAFERLGISEEEVATLSQEDLFAKVVAGLQDMESGTERTALASKLLGRGATELGGLLNMTSEETEAMRQRVHDLGGVMSDEAVKSAAKYKDTLQNMKTAFSGLSRNLTSQFMPSITEVMDGLTDIFSGNSGSGVAKIKQGIDSIAENISKALPTIMQVGAQIITSLVGAITASLPNILSSGASIIQTFMLGLVQNLPAIIQSGVQLLGAIVQGISENISLVTDAIVQIILALSEGFITMMPDLLNAGITILVGIMQGITESLPELIPVIIEVIMAIVDAITQNIDLMVQAGIDLFMALVQNMPQIIEGILEALGNLWNAIIDEILSLGDEISALFSAIWESIKQIFSPVAQWFASTFSNAWSNIKSAFSQASSFFSNVWNTIKSPFTATATWFSATFNTAWTKIKSVFLSVGSFFSTVWEAIKSPFNSVASWFKDTFHAAWEGVKNVFSAGGQIFAGIKEGIEETFKIVVNAIIGGINTVISKPFNAINGILSKLRGLSILGVKPFGWIGTLDVPQIPLLARGGVLKQGQIGLLEGSGAEAVVPLEKNKEWIRKVAQDMNREVGGGLTINMTINGAEGQNVDELATIISQKITEQYNRRRAVYA